VFCPCHVVPAGFQDLTFRGVRRVCRFISKYVIEYFPVTLHVEDYGAFDPNRAYGELILLSGCSNLRTQSFQYFPISVYIYIL
jgi:hypothetical protein